MKPLPLTAYGKVEKETCSVVTIVKPDEMRQKPSTLGETSRVKGAQRS